MGKQLIVVIVGAILSFLLEVVPGLKDVWDKARWKPAILGGLFLGVPVAAWALTCFAGVDVAEGWTCGAQGALTAAWTGFLAWLGSQGGYAAGTRHLPQPRARAARRAAQAAERLAKDLP